LLKGPNVTTLTAQNYLCPYKLYAYTKPDGATKDMGSMSRWGFEDLR
jgi:hypothetical protein